MDPSCLGPFAQAPLANFTHLLTCHVRPLVRMAASAAEDAGGEQSPIDSVQQPARDEPPLAEKIIGSVVAMGLNERLQLNGDELRERRDRRGKNDGSSSPPMPSPPEPSPPPPPVPRMPEPSPPQLTALQFTLASSDQFSLSESENPFRMRPPEAPSLLLHSMVSMLSACAMLVLACSLRAQTRRARLRPVGVVMARPVLQVYGIVPGSEEEEMHAAVEGGGSGGNAGDGGGGGGGREAASQQAVVAAIAPAAETIEVAIATGPSSSWRNWQVRATPLEAGAPVAVGQPVAQAAAPAPPPATPSSNEDETAPTPV